ncbi:hypothetical protein WICPIJ_008027 [Wickerhamomyces pijperi]|uniref:RBR-type E3 ubiquitin transferase n=1 Tax=Wickerhamomyces pijperi TaxID=599730 RepID=A0A9P8TJE8_WICPI|nr:hypothetical protein WICPIJ_008027 [Wickerhamomyces pijperi]
MPPDSVSNEKLESYDSDGSEVHIDSVEEEEEEEDFGSFEYSEEEEFPIDEEEGEELEDYDDIISNSESQFGDDFDIEPSTNGTTFTSGSSPNNGHATTDSIGNSRRGDEYSYGLTQGQFREESTSLVNSTPMKFKTYTTMDLIDKMHKQCRKLSEILVISQDNVINLLQFFSWNSERLMEDYVTDPMKVRKDAGLLEDSHDLTGVCTTYPKTNPFSCFICCDDKLTTYKLACNHEYCTDCYGRYVEDRLSEGRVIKCPDCDLTLQTRDIDNICGEGSSLKLLESSMKEYVERLRAFKWCPAPDCKGIVEVLNMSEVKDLVNEGKIPFVRCGSEGHQFCVSCLFENHSPAPCQITKNWITKCKDDSETVKWILTNTQTCPRCETSIEKNGGCNHMTCKKCRHEFCWICLGDWKLHGSSYYNCTRTGTKDQIITNENKKTIASTKESLKRYLHFYNLFSVHEVSTKLDMARCSVVQSTVRDLQVVSGISWIEAQFIADSAKVLLSGRQCLKWSYPLAFYCDSTPLLNIFENVQAELAMAVESLSKMFEIEDPAEIVEKKKEFIDDCGVVLLRQNAVLSCMKELLESKTLPDEAFILKKSVR